MVATRGGHACTGVDTVDVGAAGPAPAI